jgi:hypothetical protein
MTREKAIEIMQINRDGVANMSWSEDRTKTLVAFDMAIKALEQEPCEDWYDVPSDEMTIEQARQAVKDLRKKLAECLEQEPKFIAKSDGTIEQIKNCDDCLYKKEWEKIGKLISVVLEKQNDAEYHGTEEQRIVEQENEEDE